jgi:Carboxypeptidase regulatory-like domain
MPNRADFPLLRLTEIRAERLFLMEKLRQPSLLWLGLRETCCSRARRIGRCLAAPLVLSGVLAGACAALALPTVATAQAAAPRVVEGKVQLSSGPMAHGAIVYLKNGKTLEVRTYISTADGSFRFGQLNPDADYTVWAEYQGKKSKERSVSSFDTKKVYQVTLKVDG